MGLGEKEKDLSKKKQIKHTYNSVVINKRKGGGEVEEGKEG